MLNVKKENFNSNGYYFEKKILSDAELNLISKQFYVLLKMQGHKIGVELDKQSKKLTINQRIIELSNRINATSKMAYDQVNQMLREMLMINKTIICNENIIYTISELINCPIEYFKYHIDGILTNFPSDTKRLYKYHSESFYYPMRNNFINIWIPLFVNKKKNNGTMIVKLKGHKKSYSFNEYSGYNTKSVDSLNEDENFHQLEIPAEELKEFESYSIESNQGDGFFFHMNLPHCSAINNGDLPSYALVFRVYDFRSDYTLSNLNNLKPYSNEATRNGFPKLRKFKK
jgi:ectoine hydroxylase-related dioxygenase (phytanoyl-CoA dioxygenase family)|tara:strand:+ start:162 stop:1022 length:861 start_codon:yes stop_codon:yes gene_type:complete